MADVKYRFVHSGEQDVARAFRTIASAANDTARVQVRGARQAERETVASANRTVRTTAQAEARRWREVEQAARKIEREYQREANAAKQSAAEKTKAEEKAGKERVKAVKAASQEAAAAKRKEAKEDRELDKAAAKAKRELAKEERDNQRAAARAHREAEQKARSFQRQQRQLSQNAKDRSTASPFAAVAATGIAGAMVGGAVLAASEVGSAARDANELQEIANRLSIGSRGAGQQAVDPTVLRREMELTAMATPGMKSADVGRAMQLFVGKTGDLGSARGMAQTFATMASASGADISDIASMSASLRDKFKITDDGEMQQALASIYMQGKSGSFELKDAAGLYDKLTAAGASIGMAPGAEGIKTLGGLTQIARGATGSSDQAAFAVEAMMRQIVAKGDHGQTNIKDDFGVDVFTDKSQTKLRGIQDILVETIGGSKGNLPALQKVFGEEGIRAIRPMVAAFNQAGEAAGANATEAEKRAAGEAALRTMLDRSINVAGDWTDVLQDAAQAQRDNSAKVTAASEMMSAKMSDALVPLMDQMAESVGAATPLMDAFAGSVASAATVLGDTIGQLTRLGQNLGVLDKGDADAPVADRLAKAQGELDAIEGKALSGGELTQEQQLKRRVLKDKIVGLGQEFEKTWGYEATPDDLEAMASQPGAAAGPGGGAAGGGQSAVGKIATSAALSLIPGLGNVATMAMNADAVPAGLEQFNQYLESNAQQLGKANAALDTFSANLAKASDATRPNMLGGKFQ